MYLKNKLSKGKIESIVTYKGCDIDSILYEYKKVRKWGEDGTLFIYYENGDISQIHESVFGIEKVEIKIANMIGIPYAWLNSYIDSSEDERKFMKDRIHIKNYVYKVFSIVIGKVY